MASENTMKKYKLFVAAYMATFNATKAAIEAGYSKKTAYSIGNKLLKKVEVAEMVAEEMKKLRERMSDDASRIYAELWNQLRLTDEKIERHNEAEKALQVLEKKVLPINQSLAALYVDLETAKDAAAEVDGRSNRELKSELVGEVNRIVKEIRQGEIDSRKLYSAMKQHKMYLLDAFAWEKIQTMRFNLLRDLFDRAGYKATDKLEMSVEGGVTIIDDIPAFDDLEGVDDG
ncbi:terminase small subunit [Listeria ilorinensis]|uniref:terminase small subunit n=1 Tax=Listeria ilorinensis TaxID=2867439 RepID=UPI001EF4F2F9|nr:terminase small subunit [Listeria ilorinensis]